MSDSIEQTVQVPAGEIVEALEEALAGSVEIGRRELYEILAHLLSAEEVFVALNGFIQPSPGSDRLATLGWNMRDRFFQVPSGVEPGYYDEQWHTHPVVLGMEVYAKELAAEHLEGMLADKSELLGLEIIVGRSYAEARVQMRHRISDLRDMARESREAGTIGDAAKGGRGDA